MSGEVIQLFAWPVHIGRDDDDWTPLCGADGEGALILEHADVRFIDGYKLCEQCRVERAKEAHDADRSG